LNQSNWTELEDEIKKSLAITMERVGQDFNNIDETVKDLSNEFKHLKINQFREAIRNGSLGMYGKTFKLSTQEVCYWIREYLKSRKSSLGI